MMQQDLKLDRCNILDMRPKLAPEPVDFSGLVVIGLFLVTLGIAGLVWSLM